MYKNIYVVRIYNVVTKSDAKVCACLIHLLSISNSITGYERTMSDTIIRSTFGRLITRNTLTNQLLSSYQLNTTTGWAQ